MHADKRWMTVCAPHAGAWRIEAPEPVGEVTTLFERLRARAGDLPIAFGIDCPLGVPRAYAAQCEWASDFRAFLLGLADRPRFFVVAASLEGVSAGAPFYPARGLAGMTRLAHARALGLSHARDLNRACDQATADRPAGAPVFWTLGANQTGKAALAAWRDLLIPALMAMRAPRLWPFDGAFLRLMAPGGIAVAETYPAEAMRHLGARMAGSKRRQDDRAAYAGCVLQAMRNLQAEGSLAMQAALLDGFGRHPAGEDQFDSVLGVLCVLNVLQGRRSGQAPSDPWIRQWEGWVLGQHEHSMR
jgi:hypothetical protein